MPRTRPPPSPPGRPRRPRGRRPGRAATCRGRRRARARRRRDRRAPGRRRCARAARPCTRRRPTASIDAASGEDGLEVVARHPAAGEAALQHVRARLRVVADHREPAVALARRRLPLAQEVGDGAVERLVGGVHGPHHVVVDLHARHELEHGVGGRPVGPRAPLDHEAASHVGEAAPRRGEHALVVVDRRCVVGEHQGEAPAVGRRELLDRRDRARRAVGVDDAVVLGVATSQRHRAATRAPPRRRRRRGSRAAEPPMHGHPFDSFAARRVDDAGAATRRVYRRGGAGGHLASARPVMGIYTRMPRGTDC